MLLDQVEWACHMILEKDKTEMACLTAMVWNDGT